MKADKELLFHAPATPFDCSVLVLGGTAELFPALSTVYSELFVSGVEPLRHRSAFVRNVRTANYAVDVVGACSIAFNQSVVLTSCLENSNRRDRLVKTVVLMLQCSNTVTTLHQRNRS